MCERLGAPLDHPGLGQALSGQLFTQAVRSQGLHADVADVLAPAPGSDQHVDGVVRLSYPLTTVHMRFRLLRYLVAGVLVVGLLLGAIAGTALALDLGRPIEQTTRAVRQLATGQLPASLPEQPGGDSARWRSHSTRWRSGCTRWKSRGAGCWQTWCMKSDAPWRAAGGRCKPSRAVRVRIRRCARNCR